MRKWQTIQTSELCRHVHRLAYAALLLSGSYEEAGDLGRFRVHPGDVVLHDRFEAHLNHFHASGAVILNVALPADRVFQPGLGKVSDPDSIIRIAEKSEEEAAALLIACTQKAERECADWPDELATALMQDPSLSLSSWSEANGIGPWTVSRGFTQAFGISPVAFRARTRTRLAWKAVQTSKSPLATIAANLGFADQSHMTRSMTKMTGMGPRGWRDCCK
jgi:AraC-like DNA-binding protein